MIIKPNMLHNELTIETARQSGHEERKGQLSMSWLYKPVDELVSLVRSGQIVSDELKLKLYQGTFAERGMKERLKAICVRNNWQWKDGQTLIAYDGGLTGHTDCAMEDCLIEIKTVPTYEILQKVLERGLPFKVYAQIQAYMFWGRYKRTMVIYEERTSGNFGIIEEGPSHKVQNELRMKAEATLKILGHRAA